jgi:hypothetical protein
MTYLASSFPPPLATWPIFTGPDCIRCGAGGHTTRWCGICRNQDNQQVHLWLCKSCECLWTILVTSWPVLDGPDCPVCESPHTRWVGIDPDLPGDTWSCPWDHTFALDPEGLVYLPEDRA